MINQELYSDFLDLRNRLEKDGIPESISGLIASSLAQSQMLYKLQNISIDGYVGITNISSPISIESIGGSLSIDELQVPKGTTIYLDQNEQNILKELTKAISDLDLTIKQHKL
jgi:hypothetical protein